MNEKETKNKSLSSEWQFVVQVQWDRFRQRSLIGMLNGL